MKQTKTEGAVNEYLDAVGQESEEKASKWVIEAQDEVVKQEQKEKDDRLQQLHDARKRKLSYTQAASKMMYERAKLIDWPKGYKWRVGVSGDDKINLTFVDRRGRGYGRGVRLTGVDYLDLNALHVLATQAENTVDQIENPPQTDSGIYLK